MRICILSDSVRAGGAAVAADRLAHAFHRQRHEVHRITPDAPARHSELHEHSLFLGRKYLLLQNLFALAGKPHWANTARNKELVKQLRGLLGSIRPDVVNVHNLHGATWPPELIDVARNHAPVAWTLHDCWSFLGAYYPSHSPAPSSATIRQINAFWRRANAASPRHSLAAVTPSRWMAEQARASHWKNHLVEAIPNTHPGDLFRPLPQNAAKDILQAPQDTPLVLLAAGNLSEERKGGPLLARIFEKAKYQPVQFLAVGRIESTRPLPRNVRSFGFVSDEKLMAILYSAADLLLHPAPIDNLPNTVAEAQLCSTPVLAFATGGLPEMITPEKNGWLVREHDGSSMANHLVEILADKSFLKLKADTRKCSGETFSEERVSSTYCSFFKKLSRNNAA